MAKLGRSGNVLGFEDGLPKLEQLLRLRKVGLVLGLMWRLQERGEEE
jgi:hypothetical protein